MPPSAARRRWFVLAAKAAATVLVVGFVWGSVRDAVAELPTQAIRPHAGLLAASGAVYLVALLPMAWFWRRVLAAFGQPCRWRDVLPAYYLGHLGKYVPGKAMVVVLRTGAVTQAGGRAGPAAASVFVETPTMMAVGGALAGVLLVWLSGDGAVDWKMISLAAALALVAAAPTLPPVMRWLLAKLGEESDSGDPARKLTWRLLGAGWLAAVATWVGLAASLAFAIRAVAPGFSPDAAAAARCLLAVTLPVVAGFLSLLPGGLVVRDGLMFALLKPLSGVAEPALFAATVLLRLIWIASEVAACVILWLLKRWGLSA